MFRPAGGAACPPAPFPHTRGDVPALEDLMSAVAGFSPHTWGCSAKDAENGVWPVLFPTHVGMFRMRKSKQSNLNPFPHTRGDVPDDDYEHVIVELFSPHTWGCSGWQHSEKQQTGLFPTHVGMFRRARWKPRSRSTFPHTRGDVPDGRAPWEAQVIFSPHTWGCSGVGLLQFDLQYLFPTHVGMFRRGRSAIAHRPPFPHTRGDVPLNSFAQ